MSRSWIFPRLKFRSWFSLMGILPFAVRAWLIRKLFSFESELPKELIFKIADTKDELEQAFQILHDGYVESKLMDPESSGLRVTKHHFLPSTTVLIAKLENEVIATLSVILDGPLGLPLDSTWDISFLRKQGKSIAEISALAIKKNVSLRRGRLLLPLCKFMRDFSLHYAGVDTIVVATSVRVRDFYQCILLFEPINGLKTKRYGFVKGDKAVAQYLDLAHPDTLERYRAAYNHLAPARNLYHFFVKFKCANFQLPQEPGPLCIHNVLGCEDLGFLFNHSSQLLESLSAQERQQIALAYPDAERKSIILGNSDSSDGPGYRQRITPRYNAKGRMLAIPSEKLAPLHLSGSLRNASANGFLGYFSQTLAIGTKITCTLELGPAQRVLVRAEVMWQHDHAHGFKLLKVVSGNWDHLIQAIEKPFGEKSARDLRKIA